MLLAGLLLASPL
jgi:hypothetical protein